MPEPSLRQKREMWVYIGFLTVVIAVIWFYFFKGQLKRSAVFNRSAAPGQSLSGVLKEFEDSFKAGGELLKNMKNLVSNISSTTATALTPAQKELLLKKIKQNSTGTSSQTVK